MIEVEKAKPDDADALKKALGNYTDAQERLNMRIGKLPAISNPNVEKLLKEVDEKTAKHAEFLEQLAGKIATGTIVNDDADVSKILKNAQDNTLKTFTITVTTVNDAPSLKLKAEEQIGLAGVAINGLDLDQYERIANAKSHLESAKKRSQKANTVKHTDRLDPPKQWSLALVFYWTAHPPQYQCQ